MNESPPPTAPLLVQPLAHVPELERLGEELQTNVAPFERAATALAGLALMTGRHWRHRATGWIQFLLGAALVARGVSGHCPLYYRLGVDTRR
jgi:hypothetical protein